MTTDPNKDALRERIADAIHEATGLRMASYRCADAILARPAIALLDEVEKTIKTLVTYEDAAIDGVGHAPTRLKKIWKDFRTARTALTKLQQARGDRG